MCFSCKLVKPKALKKANKKSNKNVYGKSVRINSSKTIRMKKVISLFPVTKEYLIPRMNGMI